jgi:hypothetical protein
MNNPQAVLQEAVSLMRQGRYAVSLQKHLWFHDHALEHAPALAGVRLSFALEFWTELGGLYPEAMTALTAIRDAKSKALAQGKGTFPLFHDVLAINDHLLEAPKTVALFKLLHQNYPDLAGRCYHAAETVLTAHREYEICIAYVPDPLAKFEEVRQMRQVNLEIADENPALGSPEFRSYVEQHFADGARRLIDILIGVGRKEDAERVRDLALAVSDRSEVRSTLDQSHPRQGPGA